MSENSASTPDDQEAPKNPSTTWKDHPWWDAYPEWVNPELDYHAGHERILFFGLTFGESNNRNGKFYVAKHLLETQTTA
jgi:hypothetical protein